MSSRVPEPTWRLTKRSGDLARSATLRTASACSFRIISPWVRREHPISLCRPGRRSGFSALAKTGAAPFSAGTWNPATRQRPALSERRLSDAALDAQVEAQLGLLRCMLAQAGQGQIVAGADRHQLDALVPRFSDDVLQVGTQRLDMRLEALACPQFGPEQAVGEVGQAGRLALRPDDQRLVELLLPGPNGAPDVPVGAAERRRRAPDRAAVAHRLQHGEQRLVQVGAPLALRGEGVAEADAGRRRRTGRRRLLAGGFMRRFSAMATPWRVHPSRGVRSPPAMTDSFRPVALAHASRLINHGPTVLVTSAAGARRNVMAAAWSMPVEFTPPRIAVVIDKHTFTRELVIASGAFGICLPGTALVDLTWAVGGESGRDVDKFARHGIVARAGPVLGVPLIEARCAAWLECRLIRETHAEDAYDTCFAEVVAAAADERIFANGRWSFRDDNVELQTLHHLGGGNFVRARRGAAGEATAGRGAIAAGRESSSSGAAMPTSKVHTKPIATKAKAKAPSPARAGEGESAAALIDAKIEALGDWRGEMLARLRALIKAADPERGRGMEVERSGLVAPRADLHRRDLQEGREDDLREGRLAAGPFRPVQFQSRRQCPARHRLPRRRRSPTRRP